MKTLAKFNLAKVIDLLLERLAFERTAVELYDTILEKIKCSSEPEVSRMLGELEEYRSQEKEHEEWIASQIRDLGGDTDSVSPMADLVIRESQGIGQVVHADEEVSHLLHALLAAELVDNSGWQLLIQLADDADDAVARREFMKRMHEEEDHLIFVRAAMAQLTRKDVLGFERNRALFP